MLSFYFSSSDFCRILLSLEQVKFFCACAPVLVLQAAIDHLTNAKSLKSNLQRFYFVLFICSIMFMTLESL